LESYPFEKLRDHIHVHVRGRLNQLEELVIIVSLIGFAERESVLNRLVLSGVALVDFLHNSTAIQENLQEILINIYIYYLQGEKYKTKLSVPFDPVLF
tara:strand:+ start:2416 stop:2709 length:294 start_codon:yes stop_codon:yes gene_type:complete